MSLWTETYLGKPYEADRNLDALARTYVEKTRAYDLSVCSAKAQDGEPIPANSQEWVLINRYARLTLAEVQEAAERQGYSSYYGLALAIRNARWITPR